jgi:hypothetical protein
LVAQYYYKNIQILGIKINIEKSLIGSKDLSQVEFVKRQSIRGEEISGLNNNLVSKDSIRNVAELIDNMFYRNMTSKPPVRFHGFNTKESLRNRLITKITYIRFVTLLKKDRSYHQIE